MPTFPFTWGILRPALLLIVVLTSGLSLWVAQPRTSDSLLLVRQINNSTYQFIKHDLTRNLTYQLHTQVREFGVPSASPDGTQIAFSMWMPDFAEHDIFVLNLTADSLSNLTLQIDNSATLPAWSPDGQQLAVSVRNANGQHDIYRLDIVSGRARNLTQGVGDNLTPSWSPDGRVIAFEGRRPDDPEFTLIYQLDVRTREVTRLIDIPINAYQPRWSPDGDSLAFTSYRDLYMLDMESGDIQQLTRNIEDTTSSRLLTPMWSPDGQQLAFITAVAWERNLYVIDRNGDNLRLLANYVRDFIVPAWSADSQRIAVIANILTTPNERLIVSDRNGNIAFTQIYPAPPHTWVQWQD